MAEIVVVSPPNRDLVCLQGVLDDLQLLVKTIEQGDEALSYLVRKPSVSLVIAEHEMGGCSGLQLLEKIVNHETLTAIPFVLMGHISLSQAAGEALQKGAVDYLPRPVDFEEAEVIVSRALAKKPVSIPPADQVGLDSENGVFIIKIPERFQHGAAMQLAQLFSQELICPKRGVIIDLGRTTYMSSSGIGVIQLVAMQYKALPDKLFVCGASARIEYLLQMAGALSFFKTAVSIEDAISKL